MKFCGLCGPFEDFLLTLMTFWVPIEDLLRTFRGTLWGGDLLGAGGGGAFLGGGGGGFLGT